MITKEMAMKLANDLCMDFCYKQEFVDGVVKNWQSAGLVEPDKHEKNVSHFINGDDIMSMIRR